MPFLSQISEELKLPYNLIHQYDPKNLIKRKIYSKLSNRNISQESIKIFSRGTSMDNVKSASRTDIK